jgi:formimidoylglutamate deiminase
VRAVRPASAVRLMAAAGEVLSAQAPVHVHAAEQSMEVEACRARYGCGPVALLDRHLGLGPRWSVVHATHADDEERRLMVEAGATVVLCPLTEAYLGDGLFPARAYAAAGGRLAVGSDSNVRLDAVEELRWLEYGQRLADRARARLSDDEGLGAPLWSRLAEGGRAALGMDVGRIEPGSLADIVSLDPDHGDLVGCDDPGRVMDALVTAGSRSAICKVFVAGRAVATRPDPRLAAEFRERVRRLMREPR